MKIFFDISTFMDAEEEEVNMNSINYMSSVGEERFAASTYIKEYFHLKGEEFSGFVYVFIFIISIR